MREVYTKIENDTTAIQVEIQYHEEYEKLAKKNNTLLSVFVKYNPLTHHEEIDTFLELKESLILGLQHHAKALYGGMRVVEGWSELYFYAPSAKELNSVVQKYLRDTPYPYESNVVKDAKWDFYYKQLLPTPLEEQHIQSVKTIVLLAEEGDPLTQEREVEHYIIFDTDTQKQRFIPKAEKLGFRYKDDISSDDFAYGVALVKKHDVTNDTIREEVKELFTLAQQEQAYYEGWSTTLVLEDGEE